MATPHKIALAAAYRAAKIAYVATIRKLAQEDNKYVPLDARNLQGVVGRRSRLGQVLGGAQVDDFMKREALKQIRDAAFVEGRDPVQVGLVLEAINKFVMPKLGGGDAFAMVPGGRDYRAKLQQARSGDKVASSVNPRMVRLARNMKRKYGA